MKKNKNAYEEEVIKFVSLNNDTKPYKVKLNLEYNKHKYKISDNDYMKGDYLNLTKEEKEDFLTSYNYKRLLKYLNSKSYSKTLENKNMFYKIFEKYIGRKYIDLRIASYTEFEKFVENKKEVIVKRISTKNGEGVSKIIIKGNTNLRQTYTYLLRNKQFIVEEELEQADILNKLNPYALNYVRFTTILKDSRVYIIGTTLVTNNGGEDTITSNNIFMDLDEHGKIVGNAVDNNGKVYIKHPRTKIKFEGKIIPNMARAMKIVSIASRMIPEVRLIGWDVAITEHNAYIIGCNTTPDYGFHQYYLLGNMTNPGLYKMIKTVLGSEIKNIK